MLLCLLGVSCSGERAHRVDVYPTPQSVVWGEESLSLARGVNIIAGEGADADALELLASHFELSVAGVDCVIGQRGDAAIAEFEQFIPSRSEGYYLGVSPERIVVAGNDGSGTFYAVQTLLQIAASGKVLSVEICDFPDVAERGMIEGYYGNPLGFEERVRQFEFYALRKMNVYIYGPKDDPYHGFADQWREFYPEPQAAQMAELVQIAARNKVQFVWAVHPGNDINWTEADFVATLAKFESMYGLGVRSFAIFFDDIGGVGAQAARQVEYLNYLQREFVEKKSDVTPLILCPTQYNQAWSGGDYLDVLGDGLDPKIRVMWTGKSVCRMIDDQTMEWINARLKRKAYIWLNYPVNDYVIDHLLMGPFVGNSQTIASQLGGFVSNPMEYGEASKVALFSIGDYAWNMEAFDPQESWQAAIDHLMPENAEAFKVFCENNIDLGYTYHALRMPNESAPFAAEAAQYMDSFSPTEFPLPQAKALRARFAEFRAAAAELKQSRHNVHLTGEIAPWLTVFDLVAQQGEVALSMHEALTKGDSTAFVDNYVKYKVIEGQRAAVKSRDFEGSIKTPNPKSANNVVLPFIKELVAELVENYKANYRYKLDQFPELVLDNGSYYIKVGGLYLSNPRDGEAPILTAEEDNINPQRQEWVVTLDPNSERYKIVSAHDGRYLNQWCTFSGREFMHEINTYAITQQGSAYAIVNSEKIGGRYWNIENGVVTAKSAAANYIFEFIPLVAK